jgi:hypothetical protein
MTGPLWHQPHAVLSQIQRANHIVCSRRISYSTQNFEDDFREQHIPTTALQKMLLSAGSAAVSLLNPARPGNIISYF